MMTYLVTGGSGFIGSNFILYMFEKYGENIRIVNLDALTYAGNPENLQQIEHKENYEFVQGDICNRQLVEQLFGKWDFDRVVHFAAESHVDRSIKNPEIFVKTNVLGTEILLECAMRAWKQEDGFKANKKYLQVSTDEVYGSLNIGENTYFRETTPLNPHSPYSASKASGDMLVKAYIDTYGFPANITRCSNNYGPYQFPEKLIPLMIHNAMMGKQLPVYGDGKNIRDWLYVVDHAKAIDLVLEHAENGQIYNVGGHNEKQNLDIVKIIIRTLKDFLPDDESRQTYLNESLITYVEDRKGHDRRYAIAPDKIKSELGWFPETDFETGIKQTIQWYLQHEEWMQHVTSGTYQQYYASMYHIEEGKK